ncbi:hypothetical protein THERMOT_1963 [Bathymodiolus thermophilus thioautotrophic gill symbiont]|nr:hypothetical protein THERMOT_1963 [Bathymodiolus thermophilus thioautotrophic gill symbiont]
MDIFSNDWHRFSSIRGGVFVKLTIFLFHLNATFQMKE